jgi:hypothetical protein
MSMWLKIISKNGCKLGRKNYYFENSYTLNLPMKENKLT